MLVSDAPFFEAVFNRFHDSSVEERSVLEQRNPLGLMLASVRQGILARELRLRLQHLPTECAGLHNLLPILRPNLAR